MEEKKFHTITSYWSENIENTIKEIQHNCEIYKFMNIESALKFSFRYDIILYCLIALGPIAGILSAISILFEEHAKAIQIIVTICSFVGGAFSSIIKFSKIEQKIISYKSVATKYASLEGNIKRQLSLPKEDRVNAGQYLEWVSISFDELFNSTPLMPDNVYKKWLQNNTEKISVKIEGKTDINNKLPEANQYSDGKMKYEMKRLYGMS